MIFIHEYEDDNIVYETLYTRVCNNRPAAKL